MRRGGFSGLAWAVSLAVLVSSASAVADAGTQPSAATIEEASERYKRGTDLYNEENFRAALVEFKKAYELTGEFRVLYNVGQVCYQLQDYVCAIHSFEKYLAEGGTSIPDERRTVVKAELSKLRPRIASVTVVTNVPDVSIVIDDISRGKTPLEPVLLSAGVHKVMAVKEGRVPFSQTIEVAGAESPTIRIDLVEAGGTKVIVQQEKPVYTSQWTTLSYAGLGLGGLLVAGAGVTGALALAASNDLKDERYVGSPSDSAKDVQSRVKTLRTTSDVLTCAALVTLGTTLYLTLTRHPENPAPKQTASSIHMNVGWGTASILGSF